MKKLLFALSALAALTLLAPTMGTAQTSDIIGIYFNASADVTDPETYCKTGVAPYASLNAYIVLTLPSEAAIGGMEYGYHYTGSLTVLSTTFAAPNVIDVGQPGNHIVGFGAPLSLSPVTVLATMSMLYMETTGGAVTFYLHGTTPSSIDPLLPTLLRTDDSLYTTGLSALPGEPTAQINGTLCEVVDVEETSFDGVKSLFR